MTPKPPYRKSSQSPSNINAIFSERRQWMLLLLLLILGVLVWRAVYLHLMHTEFLQQQGIARHVRTLPIPAHRGALLDRHNELLAISTPVDSVWVNPSEFMHAKTRWQALSTLLDISPLHIDSLLTGRMEREFIYLKRHIAPNVAQQIKDLDLPGVHLQREYRRYYPLGEITAHVLGFTDVDDNGLEGMELALNDALQSVPGTKRVVQGRHGKIIAAMQYVQMPKPGRDMRLSIDRYLQYLTYRELKLAVAARQAKAGAAVIIDAHSGEILALASQPGFNPNNRGKGYRATFRNRAVTDVFEPGSTIKPFTIAAALTSGRYSPHTRIDTAPGQWQIGRQTVRDSHNYGVLTLSGIIQKSSNVGASKIALSLPAEDLWTTFNQVGLGHRTASSFPGEISGKLPYFTDWVPFEQATMSFGYGLNVTLLQLANAYTVLANHGRMRPLRFLAVDEAYPLAPDVEVLPAQVAQQVIQMLTHVVAEGGTGARAAIAGYQIAGKTGTVHKAIKGGYAEKRYRAIFAGIVPASRPRLVMAIVVDEPQGDAYFGGEVAAPIFAHVMRDALRLLNVAPDE